LKDENNSEYVLQNRLIFIDDIADNIIQYKGRQLVCPRYNFWNKYDVYDKVLTKYKIAPEVFDDKDVLNYLHENSISVYNANGNEFQKNKEYIAIAKAYRAIREELTRKQEIADGNGKVVANNLQTNFYLIAVPSYFTDASGRSF
jgi:hypothetical protein